MKPQESSSTSFIFPEVRVVEASAGSGKTFALAKRYVQLLLNPAMHSDHIPIRNILALTFTNKAAFEMKARILEFLKLIALNQLSPSQYDEILKPLNIKPNQAQEKAYWIMEELIHNYNFFQVQTIDKFINALLSGCAFKIGLTANFRIKTNAREYLEYSLDELIDQAVVDSSLSKLFEQFLHNYLYLENRTGWFPKEDMLSIIYALYAQNNTYGLDFLESGYKAEDLVKQKIKILEQMKTLKEQLPEATNKGFVKSFDKFLNTHTKGFDIDSISDYFARQEIPIRKNGSSKGLDQQWDSIRHQLQDLCEQEAVSLFNPYIEIFKQVKDGFLKLSKKDDVLFLEELNKRAGLLFDDDYVTVQELYYRLATRFHHYLIDEFQDTSRLQWHNIEKMAEEALSTGGSLFYVGDRKQAIYGFRGGEVDLFDEIKAKFNPFNVQNEMLSNNWRSQKNIVEFNNTIFGIDNLERFIAEKESYEEQKKKKNTVLFAEEDYVHLEKMFEGAKQSFQINNTDGYVQLEYIDIDKKQDRDEVVREKLIHLIEDLRKRFSYRDIAILTRGNHEIEIMTNWLLEEGIQVESERTSNIQESPLIHELVCFLKFLNSPIDNISFANFLLGDLFTKASGLSKQEMHEFIFSLRDRQRTEKDFYIYMEFRAQYEEQWQLYIEEFFRNVGLYPLYELVVSIYHRLDCLKNFPEYQGFFMHFLELIKRAEEDHADIASFIEHFENLKGEDLYVRITDSDAIKILTIHKSKGLEFPVVILPYLGMNIQVGQSGDNQQSYVMQNKTNHIDLLRLKNKYLSFSDDLYQIYAKEYKKSLFSELNNIYVGLTRACHELYGFIPKRLGSSFNLAKFLIPEEIYIKGKQVKYKQSSEQEQVISKLPPSLYYDWIDYLRDEFLEFNDVVNRRKRLKGEVVHFILSFIGNLHTQSLTKSLNEGMKEAKLRFPHFESFDEYKELIEKLVAVKEIEPMFIVEEGEVLNEQEIVNDRGHTKRIDRLIIKKDEVWIVDYKSSYDSNERNFKQVGEYCDILRGMYKDKAVRGFIIYLDEMRLEEITAIQVG